MIISMIVTMIVQKLRAKTIACQVRKSLLIRRGTTQAPQISWLFAVYYRDMSGKELERCMAISPMTLFLPPSSQYVY